MLRATEEETEDIRGYFNWQAPDLEITFMQKVYSESVLSTRHDVWDIHTDKDRWWVITNPTNLYSQEQFPNMDLVVTFHLGLSLRMPRAEDRPTDDQRLFLFNTPFSKLRDAHDALPSAMSLADFQAIGVRSREVLLELVAAAQDSAIWTDAPPQRANFSKWSEIIINDLFPGDSNKERRGLLKGAAGSAWTFSNWLTHTKSATWHDAEMLLSMLDFAVGNIGSIILRQLRGLPTECPKCGSSHIHSEQGENTETPGFVWERPVCMSCGWTGRPATILSNDEFDELISREGDDRGDEHSIMTVPLRSIRKPGGK